MLLQPDAEEAVQAVQEPLPESALSWFLTSLGPWSFILPVAGIGCFLLVLVILIRGRGPLAGASLWLVVHVPLLLGLVGALKSTIAGFSVIARPGSIIKPEELVLVISEALLVPLVALLVMFPSYVVAVVGSALRTDS